MSSGNGGYPAPPYSMGPSLARAFGDNVLVSELDLRADPVGNMQMLRFLDVDLDIPERPGRNRKRRSRCYPVARMERSCLTFIFDGPSTRALGKCSDPGTSDDRVEAMRLVDRSVHVPARPITFEKQARDPLPRSPRRISRAQARIDAATARVLDSGWYILGPEVEAFEAEWAAYCEARHAVGLANGLDALTLSCGRWRSGRATR